MSFIADVNAQDFVFSVWCLCALADVSAGSVDARVRNRAVVAGPIGCARMWHVRAMQM